MTLNVTRAKRIVGRNFLLLAAALVAAWLQTQAAEAQGSVKIGFRRGMGVSHVMAWAPMREWIEGALLEPDQIEELEVEF